MNDDLLNEILDNQETHTLILAELVRRLTRVETRVCVAMEKLNMKELIDSTRGTV